MSRIRRRGTPHFGTVTQHDIELRVSTQRVLVWILLIRTKWLTLFRIDIAVQSAMAVTVGAFPSILNGTGFRGGTWTVYHRHFEAHKHETSLESHSCPLRSTQLVRWLSDY